VRLSLVPRERRFFALFRRQGELVSQTLDELSKSLLEGRSRHPRLRDLEHECDEVTREIYELIHRTFVTPFEQGDILALASSLDDIVDLAEEIADKLVLYRVEQVTAPARAMGEALADAGLALGRALEDLERFTDLDRHREEVHRQENEGDRLYREALAELFSDALSAVELVKWKDIYDLLEQSLDRCEQTVNLLSAISIKNA
jgi:predicted phosphate transport protein (TIGR00153 family)